MRTFVLGDLHGAFRALTQVLARCGFNKTQDQLIFVGDVCDGWNEVYECVEELLTIPNLIPLLGNHDEWFRRWLDTSTHPDYWTQGGYATKRSYQRVIGVLNTGNIPATHWKFFHHMLLYYKDEKRNMFFVHGGFDRWKSITENKNDHPQEFYWDRELWRQALSCKQGKLTTVDGFDEIFIGHTQTTNYFAKEQIINGIVIPNKSPITTPIHSGGVWNVDTGAGWSGKLTIMDVDTKEYWQSDYVNELYPEQPPRK